MKRNGQQDEKPRQLDDDGQQGGVVGSDTIWYFAIGSMMNPTSLSLREIVPIESHPAEILDHKLYFFGRFGMAEGLPSPGDSFHGVVHKVDKENMEKLDKIESGYIRAPAKARIYNKEGDDKKEEEELDVWVYTRDKDKERNSDVDKPPSERYLEIMVEGAKYYGVRKEHIEYLENHDRTPRPLPEEFKCFGKVPEGAKSMPIEEVLKQNGKNGQPLCMTVNGKVLRCTVDPDTEAFQDKVNMYTRSEESQIVDLRLPRMLYDPKYGAPKTLDDVSPEHAAYIEHIISSFATPSEWEVVAHLDRNTNGKDGSKL
mmetsp:Transcript_22613/g.52183  ORF Transcript_22613/g.52183 Transcript_22613/m.52183 type:complete len:314 (+) Transcript_22613:50-991(+)